MKTVTINDIRGNLLNSVEIPDDTPKDQEIKVALEKLVQLRVSLEGANLYRANLEGANLTNANLIRVDLRKANLYQANLYSASLQEARLEGANLFGTNLFKANLEGVNLYEASLYRANLQGANLERAIIKEGVTLLKGGYFTVTNIGSKQETLEVFNTEVGLYFRRGCFFGNEEEFRAAVTEKHGNNKYAKMYLLQIDYAKIKFNI